MSLFLVITTLSFLTFNLGKLLEPLLFLTFKTSSKETNLLLQKASMKTEQSKYSMVDDFAKYFRIQRRINSVDQELSKLQSLRLKNNIYLKLFSTFGVKIILSLALFCMSIYYRYEALFCISEVYDLYPFTAIIAYPTNLANCVSVPFWIATCTVISRTISSFR